MAQAQPNVANGNRGLYDAMCQLAANPAANLGYDIATVWGTQSDFGHAVTVPAPEALSQAGTYFLEPVSLSAARNRDGLTHIESVITRAQKALRNSHATGKTTLLIPLCNSSNTHWTSARVVIDSAQNYAVSSFTAVDSMKGHSRELSRNNGDEAVLVDMIKRCGTPGLAGQIHYQGIQIGNGHSCFDMMMWTLSLELAKANNDIYMQAILSAFASEGYLGYRTFVAMLISKKTGTPLPAQFSRCLDAVKARFTTAARKVVGYAAGTGEAKTHDFNVIFQIKLDAFIANQLQNSAGKTVDQIKNSAAFKALRKQLGTAQQQGLTSATAFFDRPDSQAGATSVALRA